MRVREKHWWVELNIVAFWRFSRRRKSFCTPVVLYHSPAAGRKLEVLVVVFEKFTPRNE